MKLFKYIKIKFLIFVLLVPVFAYSGNISSGSNIGYAWGDKAGYINFGLTAGNVTVNNSSVTGYAWDSIFGWINLGPISVGGVEYGVKNNKSGNLSGYAWSEGAGWVSFDNVIINDSGKFTGIANGSSDYGHISFNCDQCGVVTTWRPTYGIKLTSINSGSGLPINFLNPTDDYTFIPIKIDYPISKNIENRKKNNPVSPIVENESKIDIAYTDFNYGVSYYANKKNISSLDDFETNLRIYNYHSPARNVTAIFTIEDSKGNIYYRNDVPIRIEDGCAYTNKHRGVSLKDGKYISRLNIDGTSFYINFLITKNTGSVQSIKFNSDDDEKKY